MPYLADQSVGGKPFVVVFKGKGTTMRLAQAVCSEAVAIKLGHSGCQVRHATGMSTRAGLTEQFPETEGKATQDNTQTEQCNAMRSGVTRMSSAAVISRKVKVPTDSLLWAALLFLTVRWAWILRHHCRGRWQSET